MALRTRAREVALQLLYQHDLNPGLKMQAAQEFIARRLRDPALEALASRLYGGALQHRAEIDRRLGEVAENWSVPRMAVVDRNLLRLAAFELMHCPDTPPRVVIDEAVELAKRFGSAESSAFVNGLLDRLANLPKEAAPPGEKPAE